MVCSEVVRTRSWGPQTSGETDHNAFLRIYFFFCCRCNYCPIHFAWSITFFSPWAPVKKLCGSLDKLVNFFLFYTNQLLIYYQCYLTKLRNCVLTHLPLKESPSSILQYSYTLYEIKDDTYHFLGHFHLACSCRTVRPAITTWSSFKQLIIFSPSTAELTTNYMWYPCKQTLVCSETQ